MDIHCVKCGEGLEMDMLHEIPGMTFTQARNAFFAKGCTAIGLDCNTDTPNPSAAIVSGALHDLLGDDVDGIAAMMEDARVEGYWA